MMQVGLSKVLSREVTHVSLIGSFDYMAPEVRTHAHCPFCSFQVKYQQRFLLTMDNWRRSSQGSRAVKRSDQHDGPTLEALLTCFFLSIV